MMKELLVVLLFALVVAHASINESLLALLQGHDPSPQPLESTMPSPSRLQELLSLVQVWQKQDQGQAAQQTLSDLTLGPGYESKTFDPDQAFKDLYRKLYGYQKYNDEQVVKLRHVQEQFADMHDKQMERVEKVVADQQKLVASLKAYIEKMTDFLSQRNDQFEKEIHAEMSDFVGELGTKLEQWKGQALQDFESKLAALKDNQ